MNESSGRCNRRARAGSRARRAQSGRRHAEHTLQSLQSARPSTSGREATRNCTEYPILWYRPDHLSLTVHHFCKFAVAGCACLLTQVDRLEESLQHPCSNIL